MTRPLDRMTDVIGAKRLLVLWVPKKFSRWKRVPWGVCLGRLWIQRTPESPKDNWATPSMPKLCDNCYQALACLHIAAEADVAMDIEDKVKAYTEELERWCGVDRYAVRSGG